MRYTPNLVLSLVIATSISCGDVGDDAPSSPQAVARVEQGALDCLMSTYGLDLKGSAHPDQRIVVESRCNRLGAVSVTNRGDLRSPWMLAGVRQAGGIIVGDENMESLHGLEQLESVGTIDFELSFNSKLTSLEELSSLREVTRRFDLQLSDGIETLHGLESLERVGDLVISSNYQLRSIEALSSLHEVRSIVIVNNPKLPNCQAQAFADRFRDTAENIEVRDNMSGGNCTEQ